MKGLDRPLVLHPQPRSCSVLAPALPEELGRHPLAALERGVEDRPLLTGQQQLQPVVAGVGDRVEADQAPRLLGTAPGDAADEAEAAGQGPEGRPRLLGHLGLLGARDDRRQGPVDVGQHSRPFRVGKQGRERRPTVSASSNGRHGI
jgi:hypothetical protein